MAKITDTQSLLLEIRNFLYKERINGICRNEQADIIGCNNQTLTDLSRGYYVNNPMSKILLYIIKKGGVISEKGIEIHL